MGLSGTSLMVTVTVFDVPVHVLASVTVTLYVFVPVVMSMVCVLAPVLQL